MTHALIKDNNPVLITGPFTDSNGIQHPKSVLWLWDEPSLRAIGVYKIHDTEIPPGKVAVASTLVFEEDTVARVYELDDLDLEPIKVAAKRDIDARAEEVRALYITAGSGQALTYQAKAEEARHFIETDGAGQYPFLSQEVGITGETLADVADVVFNMYNQWLAIGADIERVRLKAKRDIDIAETYQDIIAVVPQWPQL